MRAAVLRAAWEEQEPTQALGAARAGSQRAALEAERRDGVRRSRHRRSDPPASDGGANTTARPRARLRLRESRPKAAYRRAPHPASPRSAWRRFRARQQRSAPQPRALSFLAVAARRCSAPTNRTQHPGLRAPRAMYLVQRCRAGSGSVRVMARSSSAGLASRAAPQGSVWAPDSASVAAIRAVRSAQPAAARCRTVPGPPGCGRHRRGEGERLTTERASAFPCPARARSQSPSARAPAQTTANAPRCCFARNSCPSL